MLDRLAPGPPRSALAGDETCETDIEGWRANHHLSLPPSLPGQEAAVHPWSAVGSGGGRIIISVSAGLSGGQSVAPTAFINHRGGGGVGAFKINDSAALAGI